MWNDRMQGLAMTIRGLPIPVIAMVNGWCMGGGHEPRLCGGDLVIASENAVLGQTARGSALAPRWVRRISAAHHGERLARE